MNSLVDITDTIHSQDNIIKQQIINKNSKLSSNSE